jgi:hypothetical protein
MGLGNAQSITGVNDCFDNAAAESLLGDQGHCA